MGELTFLRQQAADHQFQHPLSFFILYHKAGEDDASGLIDQEVGRLSAYLICLLRPPVIIPQRCEAVAAGFHKRHHIGILTRNDIDPHIGYVLAFKLAENGLEMRELAPARATTREPKGQ